MPTESTCGPPAGVIACAVNLKTPPPWMAPVKICDGTPGAERAMMAFKPEGGGPNGVRQRAVNVVPWVALSNEMLCGTSNIISGLLMSAAIAGRCRNSASLFTEMTTRGVSWKGRIQRIALLLPFDQSVG